MLFPSAALAQIREEYRPLSELLATRPERVATEGNRVEVIPSGSELFFRMQEDIMGATQTIHASFFIFHNDEAGFVLRSAFQLQALDSLEVQYIAEDFIQKSRFIRPMKKAGVKVGHHMRETGNGPADPPRRGSRRRRSPMPGASSSSLWTKILRRKAT